MPGAFVRVSLDSKLFTREWLQLALPFLIHEHERVLLVLADRSLTYTHTAHATGGVVRLEWDRVQSAIANRRVAALRAIACATSEVSVDSAASVLVRSWSDFEDRSFVEIWRSVQIAYATVPSFRKLVQRSA